MASHIIRSLIRVLSAGIVLLAITALGVIGFAALHRQPDIRADAIVVLGAGMDADGTLHRETIARVEQGVALFQSGAAERIHFSGGRAAPGGPSAGQQMARLAIAHGIPKSTITFEQLSLSTLQNALFSRPMLADAESIILVTEAFHLPRTAASFWWMGYDTIHLSHSARFRRKADGTISARMIGRETLAVWFNLARALVWSATGKRHDRILH